MFFICGNNIAQGTWTNYTKDDVLLSHRIQTVLEDSRGNMWFGTYRGLHKYDGENWMTFTKQDGLAKNSVTFLFEDSKGTIWIGTALGLSKFEDGKLSLLGKKDGFPKNHPVNYIFEDSKQRLWVGSVKLFLFDNDKWTIYSSRDDAIFKGNVFLITEDPNGAIWVTCGAQGGISSEINIGGISRFYDESWYVFTEKDGLPAAGRCIFKTHLFDKKGNAWFGSCRIKSMAAGFKGIGSLMKYDGKSWTYYSDKDDLIDDCVNIILEDSKGNIWVGTHRGVSVYNGSSWRSYSQDDTLSDNQIRAIEEDSKGNIWIGTENGLCVYDGTKWDKYTEGNGLADKFISAIYEDKNGNIWVGTGDALTKGGGVSKFDGNSWTTYTEEDKLVGKLVYKIEEDAKGNLWFITLNGISKYTPETSLLRSDL